MQCPHCNKEIMGKKCSQCGATLPAQSHFCMDCGAKLAEETDQTIGQEEQNSFDLEDRVLCPDGTCTGIIIDARCSECGKPYHRSDSQEGS